MAWSTQMSPGDTCARCAPRNWFRASGRVFFAAQPHRRSTGQQVPEVRLAEVRPDEVRLVNVGVLVTPRVPGVHALLKFGNVTGVCRAVPRPQWCPVEAGQDDSRHDGGVKPRSFQDEARQRGRGACLDTFNHAVMQRRAPPLGTGRGSSPRGLSGGGNTRGQRRPLPHGLSGAPPPPSQQDSQSRASLLYPAPCCVSVASRPDSSRPVYRPRPPHCPPAGSGFMRLSMTASTSSRASTATAYGSTAVVAATSPIISRKLCALPLRRVAAAAEEDDDD
jgi:hypothetical protein